MASFIGTTITLELLNPPGAKVRGLIIDVNEQRLNLSEVLWLDNGRHQESLLVDGSNVLDLDIEPETTSHAPALPNVPIVDPAILSYARPSTSGQVSVVSQKEAHPTHPSDTPQPPVSPIQSLLDSRPLGIAEPSAILTRPFDELSLNEFIDGDSAKKLPASGNSSRTYQHAKGKRSRRKNTGRKGLKSRGLEETAESLHDGSTTIPPPTSSTILEPDRREISPTNSGTALVIQSSHLQPDVHLPLPKPGYPSQNFRNKKSKQNRRRNKSDYDDQNGWATGEVTDIQEMGDFDFEENHKRFDKKKVFEQIRQDDTTADEARLVTFNRLPPRPGTYGGKNLHYSEQVLDSPAGNTSLSSDSNSRTDEAKGDGSRLLARVGSRASNRRISSRKDSALLNSDGQISSISNDIRENKSHKVSYDAPLSSNPSLRSHKSLPQQQKRSLRTLASGQPCRCVTPLQMLELEHLAMSEFGISEDVLIENAATAIAQTARKMAEGHDGKTSRKIRIRKALSPTPLIVVLVGNHRTGSRAIAAARQLRNHNAKVILCLIGLDREMDLLDSVRQQINIFRKCGGRIVSQSQLMETLSDMHASNDIQSGRHLTTDLIIDAMLGMHLTVEDLRMEDQTAYSQLVQWANLCDVTTISVDIPSGVDASTGKTPDLSHTARLKAEASRTGIILQGDPELVLESNHVLSLGAPKIGLLLGLDSVASFQNHNSWLVADIGLDDSVWKKSGLCIGSGVNFGEEWVIKLKLAPDTN